MNDFFAYYARPYCTADTEATTRVHDVREELSRSRRELQNTSQNSASQRMKLLATKGASSIDFTYVPTATSGYARPRMFDYLAHDTAAVQLRRSRSGSKPAWSQ